MIKNIFLLGSTGSIGDSTLKVINKDRKKFKVILLTTNSNIKKIYKQAVEFKVKNIVIYNQKKYLENLILFKKRKINVFFTIRDALRKIKKKSFITVNAISGIDGLEPSLDVIKYTKNLAIANKESIICGWKLINKELKKNKTKFIPLDSEHFSIWSLLKDVENKNIKKIYLTASGGPFLNTKLKYLKRIKPIAALNYPNWKMGKKISIDSATMMNKIFEVIEAIKIFNFEINKFQILIHPKSYIHAIIDYNSGLTKLVAHETTMEIPIANALNIDNKNFVYNSNLFNYNEMNGLNFLKPDLKKFPLLKLLKYKFKNTYLETILVSANDFLVKKYLTNEISYTAIQYIMLKVIKKPYFSKFYIETPNNINEIKIMVKKVNHYLNKYIKSNETYFKKL